MIKTKVKKILITREQNQSKAVGVQLADGSKLYADQIVSNADPGKTFGELIAPEYLPPKLQKRLEKTTIRMGHCNSFWWLRQKSMGISIWDM